MEESDCLILLGTLLTDIDLGIFTAKLDPSRTLMVADVGDALFASSELVIRGQTEFIAPAYYTSMGFATPAAPAACHCASSAASVRRRIAVLETSSLNSRCETK